MADASLKTVLLLAAIAAAGVLVSTGMQARVVLNDKIVAQEGETEALMRWRQSYQALVAPKEKWDKSFRKADSFQSDLGKLAAHVGLEQYGLQTDIDTLYMASADHVMYANQKIGLTKICLANGQSNGGGFLVAAENYEKLLNGIDQLSKRLDITVGNISLQGDKAFPVAKLGDFCVLVRD